MTGAAVCSAFFFKKPPIGQCLLNEYEEIRANLEKELSETGKSEIYTNLNRLIIKIADYICQNDETVRKGIGDVMGGKVLELESERLERKGEERLSILINHLIQDGRNEEIQQVVTNEVIRKALYKEYGI